MTSGRNPTAELLRDAHSVPVLHMYNLGPQQMQRLHDVMVVNGEEPIHEVRSSAQAHLGQFDTFDGVAVIHVHGEDTNHYDEFLSMLASTLSMHIPCVPDGDYRPHWTN